MLQTEAKITAAKTAGGGVVAAVSYVSAEHFISAEQAQIYAAIFAGIMTGLYFLIQAVHTALKIWWDYQAQKKGQKHGE